MQQLRSDAGSGPAGLSCPWPWGSSLAQEHLNQGFHCQTQKRFTARWPSGKRSLASDDGGTNAPVTK